jgi:hypothetical protein
MKTCVLCGVTDRDVTTGLIEWQTPVGNQKYTSGPRCKDVAACRWRAMEQGEEWDVVIPSRLKDAILGAALVVLLLLGSQP